MDDEINDFPVFDYSNNKVRIFGIVRLNCVDLQLGSGEEVVFLVVDDRFEPILGLGSCIDFGLVKRMDVHSVVLPEMGGLFIEQYMDVFDGFGKFRASLKFI